VSHKALHHTTLAFWDTYLTTINGAILVEEDDFELWNVALRAVGALRKVTLCSRQLIRSVQLQTACVDTDINRAQSEKRKVSKIKRNGSEV